MALVCHIIDFNKVFIISVLHHLNSVIVIVINMVQATES